MTSPHEQALAAATAAIQEIHFDSHGLTREIAESAITAYLAALPAPDLAEWEKAAEGVTPGPWRGDRRKWATGNMRFVMAGKHAIARCESTRNIGAPGNSDANLTWIARCSPDNVLSALRSLSAKLAAVERERDAFRAALATACGRWMVADAKVKALTERLAEMEAER